MNSANASNRVLRPVTVLPALIVAVLVSLPGAARAGEDFEPVDGAAEQVQSRRFAVDAARPLLLASLAVLQDIRYMVTESEVDPGLIVAEGTSRACGCRQTLTISVQPAGDGESGQVLRLTASQPRVAFAWLRGPQEDEYAFHGAFFAHLDRELHREAGR